MRHEITHIRLEILGNRFFHLTLFCYLFFMSACTQVIEITDLPQPKQQIVVEGTIENNEPPFILLTRNSPYFGGISLNDLSKYFVNGAFVQVWTETDTVQLTEFCLGALPTDVQKALLESLGYENPDTANLPNICIYSVPNIFQYFLTGDTTGVFVGKTSTE